MKRFVTLGLVLSSGVAAGADWSQFRGPGGTGVSPEAGLPVKWSKGDGLKWKAELPARGVSSPVVRGGRVYVTCSSGAKGDRLHTLAFDAATGERLWHRQLAATGSTNCHPMTAMAAPTPAADDTGVYALFATGDVAAFDRDGTLRWYRSLVGDYPSISNQVGMASSPVLAAGRLIVPMDNAGESFLAAVDTKTGKNVWKVPRTREVNWVSPLVRQAGGKAEVIFPSNRALVAYSADTGERTWTLPVPGAGIPSPSLAGDVLYVPGREFQAFKLGGDKPEPTWKSIKVRTGMASPLATAERVYASSGDGVVIAVNAKTGKELWQERTKGKVSASPIAGDGKVYVTNEKGLVTVLKDADTFEVLAENDLGEETLATPAIADGSLFIRTDRALYRVGGK